MDLDLDALSTEELKCLHHQISSILNARFTAKRFQDLAKFRIGDRVEFEDSYGETVTGIIERLNRKTVSIGTSEGPGYRVSPGLVRLVQQQPIKIVRPKLLDA